MKKLGVMVCTNSAIDYIPHKYNIPIIRSRILFGDQEFVDFEELTADKFYEMIEHDPTLFPRTAMASTGEMLAALHGHLDRLGPLGLRVLDRGQLHLPALGDEHPEDVAAEVSGVGRDVGGGHGRRLTVLRGRHGPAPSPTQDVTPDTLRH